LPSIARAGGDRRPGRVQRPNRLDREPTQNTLLKTPTRTRYGPPIRLDNQPPPAYR
jgi:hypothetical protein